MKRGKPMKRSILPMPALLRADARTLPLPDDSVDLIVTSPPYFGLRSYQDGGEHYGGQVGSEPTPAEFVGALIECTREMVRVLKPTGSIFVNLGDTYDGQKSLRFLPERYRIAAVDELGLIARAVIVWNKPNGLPESVTDRVRRSHEDWVHLTKQPRYYSAVDEIREPASGYARASANRPTPVGQRTRAMADTCNPSGRLPGSVWEIATQQLKVPSELGIDHFAAFPMEWPRRLVQGWCPREVCTACGEGRRPVVGYHGEPAWTEVPDTRINQQVATEWCRALADWCDQNGVAQRDLDAVVGTKEMGSWWASRLSHRCRVPSVDQHRTLRERWPQFPEHPGEQLWEHFTRRVAWTYNNRETAATAGRHVHEPEPIRGLRKEITGYACACPDTSAPSTPGVVLDPFGGTGTTALVATMLGRRGVSVDLSADYCRLAQWRTADPKERAKAAGTDTSKVAAMVPGQGDLFGDAA